MGVGDTPVKDISSVAVTHLDPGAHVDMYGEHGHFGKDPVVHTADGRFVPIDSPFGQTKPKTGKGFPIGVPAKHTGLHQDHHMRTTAKLPGVTGLDPGDHIDFHGDHDNLSGKPVLHKTDGRRLPLDSAVGLAVPHSGAGHQIDTTATHLGIARKHVQKTPGLPNIDPSPHIDAHVKHAGSLIGVPHLDPAPTLPGVTRLDPGDHIDFHGVHDNLSGKPVLHKADGRRIPIVSAVGPAVPHSGPGHHIDVPATQMGIPHKHMQKRPGVSNIDQSPFIDAIVKHAGTLVGVPQVPRVPRLPGVTSLDPGDHIDFHGVHGNLSGKTVLHKTDGRRVPMDSAVGQIDPHAAGHVAKRPKTTQQDPGHHIDPPGKHGNFGKHPVLHTADGKRFVVDPLFGDIDPHAVPVKKPPVSFKKQPVLRLPPGSHIDPPEVHGNTHNVPVIHTPDGKHVHLGRARGHTIDKLVTGVGLKHMPDTVIDLSQTVVVKQDFPDLPPHTHIKPDLPPVDGPLAHIKPEFPVIDGVFKRIKPDIPPADTIPDLFSTETSVMHPTEHMSHRDIVPDLSPPKEKPISKQALNKLVTGVGLKHMPDTVIDLPQTIVKKDFPDLPSHAHIKPDLPPVDRPLAHIKPEFPVIDGLFKRIKPDIPPADTIPDLFSTETSVMHSTDLMSHRDIVPDLSPPIKKPKSKQTLNNALNKQIHRRKQLQAAGKIANQWQNPRLQQQHRQKLERYGSRSRRKFRKPSRRPASLPPLKPARRVRPQKNLGRIVKNIFQRMYGHRGGGRGRGRVGTARFRQGRRRRGRRGRQRRFRRDHE